MQKNALKIKILSCKLSCKAFTATNSERDTKQQDKTDPSRHFNTGHNIQTEQQ